MNCYYCHGIGTVEKQQTRFCACDAPQPFIVENVPALVCIQCGDKTFSGEVVSALEKIKDGKTQVSSLRTIRVFDFVSEPVGRHGTAHNTNPSGV